MRVSGLSPEDVTKIVAEYLKLASPDTASEAIGLLYKIIGDYETNGQYQQPEPYPISFDVDCGECTVEMSFSCMSNDVGKHINHAINHMHAPEPIVLKGLGD